MNRKSMKTASEWAEKGAIECREIMMDYSEGPDGYGFPETFEADIVSQFHDVKNDFVEVQKRLGTAWHMYPDLRKVDMILGGGPYSAGVEADEVAGKFLEFFEDVIYSLKEILNEKVQ